MITRREWEQIRAAIRAMPTQKSETWVDEVSQTPIRMIPREHMLEILKTFVEGESTNETSKD